MIKLTVNINSINKIKYLYCDGNVYSEIFRNFDCLFISEISGNVGNGQRIIIIIDII